MIKCPNCGFEEIPDGSFVCPQCGKEIITPPQELTPPPLPSTAEPSEEIPWKKRDQIGFFEAFVKNLIEILTKPVDFYQKVKVDGDWISIVLWVVINAWIAGFFSFIWSGVFHIAFFPFLTKFKGYGAFPVGLGIGSSFIFSFLLAPIWYLIGYFIWTALVHLTSLILGDAEKGFEATSKAVFYSSAPAIFNIIPLCGSYIAGIWGLVLTIIGLKYVHKTETWKAVLAPLIWFFLCILCGIATSAFFFAFLSRGFSSY